MSHPGGIGRVTSIKANWFAERGHDVWVVTANQCGEQDYYELHPSVKRKDFAIGFQLGIDNGNLLMKFVRKIGKMRKYCRELEQFIYEVKPDIVVSTFTNDSDFLYKLKDGSKKVLEFHFSHEGFKSQMKYGPQTLKNKLLLTYRLKKHERIAKKYDAFVVLTHEDAESWKGYDNLHVINNMLSFEPQEISTCTEKRVIAVGRLDFQKKFDRLVEIWALVNKECPEWRLDIFGQGPDKESLLKQIHSLGLNKVITIYPPTKKIGEEYQKSSVFVMTSTYEGLPMTLLEAISYGLPCVSYLFPCGPRDIIENGKNGYLIEGEEKERFTQRLVELMQNEELRQKLGRNAKESSKKYNVDNIMEQWLTLFSKIT
jgi:glycosyltransferase involved in cell wall biosynthesis